jgi:hypothetical protein
MKLAKWRKHMMNNKNKKELFGTIKGVIPITSPSETTLVL